VCDLFLQVMDLLDGGWNVRCSLVESSGDACIYRSSYKCSS